MHESTRMEWIRGWGLVLSATLGVALTSVHIYTTGLFIQPLEQEFGWSRAEITASLTLLSIAGVLGSPFVGVLIDRFGPRRIAVPGTMCFCLAIAALSLTAGSVWSWWLLWSFVAIASVFLSPTLWSAAISTVFSRSRGVALAVVLSGTGIGSALSPLMANFFISAYGWRTAYIALGGLSALVVLPVIVRYFYSSGDSRSAKDKAAGAAALAAAGGWTVREGLRRRQFYQLAITAFLTTMVVVGFIVHLVPMLQLQGINRTAAASLAGMVGLTSIAGRLIVGYLLDRVAGPPVGMVSVGIPMVAAAILLAFPGSMTGAIIAVLFLGFAIGGEYDATIYLSTRYFGLQNFGSLFGYVASALLAGVGLGALFAGLIFDRTGSYEMFLIAVIAMSLISSVMMITLGRYPQHQSNAVA